MAMDLEQFCKAIDIIVSERLSNLSFDTTMICTILDASDKDRGHYIVSDGTIRFDAYTNDTSYKENDQVRVSVLNGNFNERKFIEGLYVGDDSGAPVEYISPLETSFPLEENAISKMGSPQNISSFQIHTNTDDEALIWEVDISNDPKYQTLQENGIYNTITLSADFMTNLGDLSQGNYGLVLDLFIKKSKDDNVYEHRYITFDSSEMIGNPYSFEIYSHQEKKINIASFGIISMIRLSAYEGVQFDNKGRLNEHRIENPFIDNSGYILGKHPINIRNIKLGFGNDLITITNNSLQLYTTSPYYYNYNEPTNETNNKTFGLLWLNKTDTNEYIGYSNGVYDTTYDEIEYRKNAHQDSRLTAQMNKIGIADDQESLTLAANIAEIESHMIKAYDLLTTDLSQVIQALGRQLTGAPTILTELNKLIKNWDSGQKDANGNSIMNTPLLNLYRYNAQQATLKLMKYYSQILNYGYNVQNQIIPNNWNQEAINTRALSNEYKNEQTFYVNETDSIVKKNAFNGVVNWDYDKYYEDFKNNVNNGIEAVETFFSMMATMTAAGTTLNGYAGIKEIYNNRANAIISVINDYLDQIDKICANDVSILLGYKNKTDYRSYNTEEAAEKLVADENKYCIYWYQYEPGFVLQYDSADDADNTEYLFGNFAGVNWKRIPEKNNIGLPQSKQSKPAEDGKYYYIAQAAENEYTTSIYMDPGTQNEKIKVIMFYNHEMITSNIIEFENRDVIPKDKKVDATDVLRIEHDVDSQDHYQAYSAAYDLVNISDGGKMRQLKCYYEGVLSGDETLANSWLYWYIPTNATLLTYDKDYLVNTLGFSTDADGKTEYSLDNYVYFAKKVLAQEEKDTDPETGEEIIKLDDTTRIFVYKIKSFYEPSATNNTILVKARIPGYKDSIDGEKYFTFSTFGNSGTKYTFSIVPGENRIGYSGQNGDNWNRGLNLNMTLKDADNNPIQMSKTIPSDNINSTGTGLNVQFIAPSGRTLPKENYSEIKDSLSWNIALSDASWDNNEVIKNFIGILQASVTLYNDNTKGNVNLSTLYAVPYSANPQYYIGGPTIIVYNNQGTVSRVSEEPFKLFEHTKDGDKVVENVEWKLDYYDKNGNLITINNNDVIQDNIYAYMPKLNKDNTLTPAPLYFTYESENEGSVLQQYYPVAKCYSNITKNILWSQPIIITQNKYASSMLNNWDGTFTIDEANGTLMSTMLGAGRKTKNNTFEGVLIGDIAAGDGFDPDNASGIGIYGFNDGDQSFHFGTDGTAFLGKSGRGRILFDGNSGTISSASYQQNKTTAGMKIDLDDGFIDMLGTTKNGENYTPEITGSGNNKAQAHIHIDVKSPYFKIRSSKQTDENKYLYYISNDEYYIQTDDYKKTTFQTSDRQAPFTDADGPGDGFKLNLKDSLLDAYKLKITSKNLFINSTGDGKPYFVIKSNYSETSNESYRNLMYVDNETYYLQSVDFKPKDNSGYMGSGMKLTMRGVNPGIETYNFTLRSGNTGAGDHRIVLQDKSPYFIVNTNGGTETNPISKSLAVIGDNEFYFQSADYLPETNSQRGVGMRLSLSGKELKAYSGFTLKAYKPTAQGSSNSYILVDATAAAYPFVVYGGGTLTYKDANGSEQSATKQFRVNWDGTLDAVGGTFKGAINATSGTLGSLEVVGQLNGGIISGSTILGGTLDIGGSGSVGGGMFTVNSNGHMVCKSATIGGWNVTASSFSGNGITFAGGIGGGISSSFWNVDKDGKTTITDLIVSKSLTTTDSCEVYIDGKIGVGTKPVAGFDLIVGVDAQIKGDLHMVGDIVSQGNTGDKISFNQGTWIYGSMTSLFAATNQIGKDINSTTEIRGTLSVMSTTTLTKKLTVQSDIDVTDSGSLNISGNFVLDGTAEFNAPTKILVDGKLTLPEYIRKYSKSLLNITFGSDDAETDGVVGEAAKVSNALQLTVNNDELLTYDGSAEKTLDFGSLAFVNDIKKKFNMTLSGTVTASNHDYYILDDATGGSYATYKSKSVYVEGSRKYPTYVRNHEGWVIKCSDSDDYYHVDTPRATTFYERDSTEYYPTYRKAGTLTVTLTKSQDVTFEPDTSAPAGSNNDVTISATGATATISR